MPEFDGLILDQNRVQEVSSPLAVLGAAEQNFQWQVARAEVAGGFRFEVACAEHALFDARVLAVSDGRSGERFLRVQYATLLGGGVLDDRERASFAEAFDIGGRHRLQVADALEQYDRGLIGMYERSELMRYPSNAVAAERIEMLASLYDVHTRPETEPQVDDFLSNFRFDDSDFIRLEPSEPFVYADDFDT
jgi:hypothetical protein